MTDCCEEQDGCAPPATDPRRTRTLRAVLGINGVMFVAEMAAGLLIGSVALLADSLDMLGDTLTYGVSLAVVGGTLRRRSQAAVFKGVIMAGFGLFVLGQTVYRAYLPEAPDAALMGSVAGLALAANLVCFGLLWRHRAEDINMRSVWLCSRNDLLANLGVIAAAGAVALTRSPWPDLVMGALIAALFLKTAGSVIREALGLLKEPSLPSS